MHKIFSKTVQQQGDVEEQRPDMNSKSLDQDDRWVTRAIVCKCEFESVHHKKLKKKQTLASDFRLPAVDQLGKL